MKNIGIVLKGYPRLSETFIAQEIRELERLGFQITIYSLRHPYDVASHPIHEEIDATVVYLPEYLHQEPARTLRALLYALASPGLWRAGARLLADWWRDRSRNRLRRFGQALVLNRELTRRHDLLYAHFMPPPASVARYASTLGGIKFRISAHAKDIWTLQEWELVQKLRDCRWLVTCTAANHHYLQSLTSEPDKVHLLYHGIDLNRFAPPESHHGRESTRTELVSVGRLVEKKGYQYLLQALASLPESLQWHFTHIGGGELRERLQQQATELGIDQHISWLGAQPQQRVLEQFRQSDIFVLPSIIGEDGDRDGLPNVLMEAQSQRLTCLSTDISGIPELIKHGESGWLVAQKDAAALSDALRTLITDKPLRERLANAGLQSVTSNFSHSSCITRLHKLLEKETVPAT